MWLNPSTGMPALRQIILLVGAIFNFLSSLIIMSCGIDGQTWEIMTRLSGLKYFLILIGMLFHKIGSVWLTILSTNSREERNIQ